jgi:hypothetical protein
MLFGVCILARPLGRCSESHVPEGVGENIKQNEL